MDRFADALPRDEAKVFLKQLLDGKGQQAERSIKNRFAAWRRSLQTGKTGATRRTVAHLRQNAKKARQIRLENQNSDRKRRDIKRRKEREAYLQNLSRDFPKVWKAVQKTVKRASGLAYDEACRALVDISEAYALHASNKQFQEELKKFMADHMRRKALIQRLGKAGIWKDI